MRRSAVMGTALWLLCSVSLPGQAPGAANVRASRLPTCPRRTYPV
ncbi:MAG: hypothetical protein ACRD3C_24810 [Vicinamibacterales bacterium]